MRRARASCADCIVAALFWTLPALSAAEAATPVIPPAGPAAPGPAALLVEVQVNGEVAGALAMLRTRPDGCHQIEAAPMREAGLYDGASAEVCLQDLPDAEYRIDREGARVEIFSERLAPDPAIRPPDRPAYAPQITGLIGQYSLSLQDVDEDSGRFRNGFGDVSLTLHTPYGRLQNDQIASWDGRDGQVQRLATVYERDFPDNMARLTLGDSFTRAPRWGRLSAFAGVQFGTDFAMDPDETYRPYQTFQTLLKEQSQVDVRLNGTVRQRESLSPGFNTIQISPETGLNEVEIAIRDASGLTRIEDVSFFASPDGLAKGRTDYSASLGVQRRFDGLQSEYDGTLLASGLMRRGLSHSITVEAHGEYSEDVALLGAGAIIAAETAGVLNLSASVSETQAGERGHLVAAGLERNTRRMSFQVQARLADEAYADAAAFAGTAFPDVSVRANAGIFTRAGSFRAGYTQQRDKVLDERRFVSFGWDLGLDGNRATLSLSGYHDEARGESGGTLSLRVSVGDYAARASGDQFDGQTSAAIELSRLRQAEERLDWSLRAASGEAGDSAQGDIRADIGAAEGFLHAGVTGGSREVSAGVRGGFTAFHRHLAFARQTTPATVVVHAPGLQGVPVYLDNRRVAETDAEGVAVVAGVRPFEVNRLSLHPEDVPLDFAVSAFDLDFVPRRGIAEVTFNVGRDAALAFTVFLHDGTPLPMGARVEVSGTGERCPTGMDGRVYCTSVEDTALIIVTVPEGRFTQSVSRLRQTGRFELKPDGDLQFAELP